MTDQISRVVLRYDTDQASLNMTKAASESVKHSLESIANATIAYNATLKDGGVTGVQAATRMQEAFNAMTQSIVKDDAAVQSLRKTITGATADTKELAATTIDYERLRQENVGYGVRGGAIGPALPPTDDGGGGGIPLAGIRRTGSALTQLGLGDIGRPVQLLGDLGQVVKEVGVVSAATGITLEASLIVPLGIAAVALGAIALASKGFIDIIGKGESDVDRAVKSLDAYYKAIGDGTTKSIKAQIAKLESDQIIANQEKADLEKSRAAAAGPAVDLNAPISANQQLPGAVQDAAGLIFDTSAAGKRLKELDDQSKTTDETITALNRALGSTGVAANDAAEAEKVLQAERDKLADKSIADAKNTAQLEATGTSKGIKERVEAIGAEQVAINKALAAQNLSAEETKKLTDQLSDLTDEENNLRNIILPIVKLREDEAKAAAYLKKQTEGLAAAQTKYEDAQTKATEDGARARADIEAKYADKQVELARKAREAAQDSYTKLVQKQTDLGSKLDQDVSKAARDAAAKQLDEQISFQREEVKSKQDHLTRLQDIQRNAQDGERNALLDRNFLALAKNSQTSNSAITTENQRFEREEQARITAFNNQHTDDARHEATSRQERLIAYHQSLSDALLAYNRELDAQRVKDVRTAKANQRAHTSELAALNTKINLDYNLRHDGYLRELKLLSETEAEREKIITDAAARARAALTGTPLAGAGTHAIYRANGGALNAFQDAIVNEPGSSGMESFTANGRTLNFPGFGLFRPAVGGQVNANKGGKGTVENNFYVQGNPDPMATARALEPMVRRVTLETMDEMG